MDLHTIASAIDIGLTLAEVNGEISKHRTIINYETQTLEIFCFLNSPLKEIKCNLKIIKPNKEN